MLDDKKLIKGCLKNNPIAQKELYNRFASKMYGICLRYTKDDMEAKDVMQDAFVKVFNNLIYFKYEGSLESWVKKIIINTAINSYRKNVTNYNSLEIDKVDVTEDNNIISDISTQELLSIIKELPKGFRMIINLYAIEGYNHREIGEMLNISENTSKSQLSRARLIIQEKINKRYNKISYEKASRTQDR